MEENFQLLSPYLTGLLVATGIGFIIGLEREFKASTEKDEFAGIRTYPLISALGFVCTTLSHALGKEILMTVFPSIIVLIGITYYVRSQKGHMGLSSEIALIIAFALGCMAGLQLIREALAAAVITTTLLSLKGQFKAFINQLTQDEIYAFIKFIILSMLVLPFLPDTDYGPAGILNPSEIGFIVVIVSSLSFIGYLLVKFIGPEKGILLTALFGGLFSSTSVAWVFSSRSREADQLHNTAYAAGILLASSIMFLRVAAITAIFNLEVFNMIILPTSCMAITGLLASWIVFNRKNNDSIPDTTTDTQLKLGNPANIVNALSFGLLYIAISLMVYYGNRFMGDKGLLVTGLISGLADVDAISISMSKFALASVKLPLAILVIITAMLSNTFVKAMICITKGSLFLRKRIAFGLGSVIGVGLLYVVIFMIRS